MKLFRQSEPTSNRSARCVSCNRKQASSALALQQERASAALALQQEQAWSQQQAAADALALHQQKKENQLMRTEAMLRDRSVKLLFAKGLLNVRGAIEWLAEDNSPKYFIGSDPGWGKVWEAILADPVHQDLEQCLVRATGKQKQKDKNLHRDISDIYQHASNHVPGRVSPALHNPLSTVVDIALAYLPRSVTRRTSASQRRSDDGLHLFTLWTSLQVSSHQRKFKPTLMPFPKISVRVTALCTFYFCLSVAACCSVIDRFCIGIVSSLWFILVVITCLES